MENLLQTLGLRKRSRREQVQDTVSDTIHSIADSIDELVDDTRRKGPRMARRTRKGVKNAQKQVKETVEDVKEQVADAAGAVRSHVSDTAGSVRSHVADATDSVKETSAEARHRVSDAASSASADASAKLAAAVAALSALNLDWDAIFKSLSKDLGDHLPDKEEVAARANKAADAIGERTSKVAKVAEKKAKHTQIEAKKAKSKVTKARKGRKYPGFWIWLLRLGVGYLFFQRLRSKDIAAYVDHEAADELRQRTASHPVAWYKDLLDTLFIPNASIFASIVVAAEVLTALGLITGVNRRLSSLLGLILTSNDLLAEYQDADERGENVLLILTQLLLLRTGG